MAHLNKILVTGGAGYIGSTLVPFLLQKNLSVRILDNFLYGDYGIASYRNHPLLEVYRGDIRNKEDAQRSCEGCSAVLHLAGTSGDHACNWDEKACVEINYIGTKNMVESAEVAGVSRFIFASSCSVYGAEEEVVSESSPPHPLTLYARTKLDAEKIVLSSFLPCPTVFRLATVFGLSGRMRLDLVLNQLTLKAWKEGKLTVLGGSQWRPLIHVSDVARAFWLCLNADEEKVSRKIFNIGDDRNNIQIRRLAELVHQKIPSAQVQFLLEQSDLRNYRVSFALARSVLGFEAQVSLEQGIEELSAVLAQGAFPDYKDPKYSTLGRFL
ncbi:MAG: NAD-dependent epimerase/dehydratase family protein [bacterium JZ-2024 1]